MKEIGEWSYLSGLLREPWSVLELLDPAESYTEAEISELLRKGLDLGFYSLPEIIHNLLSPMIGKGYLITVVRPSSPVRYRVNEEVFLPRDLKPPWTLTGSDARCLFTMKKLGEKARRFRRRLRELEKQKKILREELVKLSEIQGEIDNQLEDPVLLHAEEDLAVYEFLTNRRIKIRR